MSDPISRTASELRLILRDEISKILGNNVTTRALQSPGDMGVGDVLATRHLYERLGVAFAALGALRGYDDAPRGFKLREEP